MSMSARNIIREMIARDPFRPFRVVATSGESYTVHNPGLVIPLKSELFIAQPNSDQWTVIPFLHVAAVETTGNGHPSRGPARRRGR